MSRVFKIQAHNAHLVAVALALVYCMIQKEPPETGLQARRAGTAVPGVPTVFVTVRHKLTFDVHDLLVKGNKILNVLNLYRGSDTVEYRVFPLYFFGEEDPVFVDLARRGDKRGLYPIPIL